MDWKILQRNTVMFNCTLMIKWFTVLWCDGHMFHCQKQHGRASISVTQNKTWNKYGCKGFFFKWFNVPSQSMYRFCMYKHYCIATKLRKYCMYYIDSSSEWRPLPNTLATTTCRRVTYPADTPVAPLSTGTLLIAWAPTAVVWTARAATSGSRQVLLQRTTGRSPHRVPSE